VLQTVSLGWWRYNCLQMAVYSINMSNHLLYEGYLKMRCWDIFIMWLATLLRSGETVGGVKMVALYMFGWGVVCLCHRLTQMSFCAVWTCSKMDAAWTAVFASACFVTWRSRRGRNQSDIWLSVCHNQGYASGSQCVKLQDQCCRFRRVVQTNKSCSVPGKWFD
jgi:hypothetical protein